MRKYIVNENKTISEIKDFFKKKKLDFNKFKNDTNIIKPDLLNLYYLYKNIVNYKRTTILEFGSGWSSLIFALSLNELKKKYSIKISKIRRGNPFELFIIENNKKYLNITKKRINSFFKKNKIKNICKIHYVHSNVRMTEYKKRIATEYKKLPICNPDFIYLDGPDQKNVIKGKSAFTTNHIDLMPMSSDILKIEYFLIPGTIILVDGRKANVNFLKDHLRRNWVYSYNKKVDLHFFYLNDKSLGKINDSLLKFYRN